MEIKTKTIRAMEILNSLSKVSGDQLGQVAAELVSRRNFLQIIEKSAEIVATIGGSGVAKEIGNEIEQQISPDQETVGFFANYPVGEAKTGQIFTLERVFNAFPQDSFALQGIAWEKITPEKGKKIDIKILEMKGLNETAEIGVAYEKNPVTQAPNGRSWLVLSYADVKDESGNIIKGVLKPLNKGLIGGATTFSLEMGIIDNSKEYGEIVMGPIDEAGGVTPVFVFDVKVSTDKDGKESIEYGGVSFIPFFTDTLQSGPIEAPKTIIRHAENARARIAESPEPALPAEMEELQKSLEGTNYALGFAENQKTIILKFTDADGNQVPVPEITFVLDSNKKPVYVRQYSFDYEGTMIPMTVDGTAPRDMKVIKDETGITLDFSGWKVIDGQWIREKVISPEGEETEFLKYSTDEVVAMLISDGGKVTEEDWEEITSETRESTLDNARDLLGYVYSINKTTRFEGMDFPNASKTFIYHNVVSVNSVNVPAISYVYINLKNQQSLVVWKLNGVKKSFIVDSNLGGDIKPLAVVAEAQK